MRRAMLMAIAAAATISFATPAMSATTVSLDPINGNVGVKIKADTPDANQNQPTVYGTDGVEAQDVVYSGNAPISITGGNGFAQITSSSSAFTVLTIDPKFDFTSYEFSVAVDVASNILIEYALASDPGTWLSTTVGSASNPFVQQANSNVDYVLSSTDPLAALRITSDHTINAVKQNTIILATPGAVPEPATWAMMLVGFGGMGIAMRRRRKPALAQIA